MSVLASGVCLGRMRFGESNRVFGRFKVFVLLCLFVHSIPIYASDSSLHAAIKKCNHLMTKVVAIPLPEIHVLVIKKRTGDLFFEHVRNEWNDSLQSKRFAHVMEKLESEREISSGDQDYIQSMKNQGSGVRIAFRFFTASHKVPKAWQFMVQSLGEIKDFGDLHFLEEQAQLALDLRRWYFERGGQEALQSEMEKFQSTSSVDVRAYIEKVIARDLKLVGKTKMTGFEFHLLKKDLWMLFELYYFVHGQNRAKDRHYVFERMTKLFKRYHDPIIAEKCLRGKRRRDILLALPDPLREKLVVLLRSFEIR